MGLVTKRKASGATIQSFDWDAALKMAGVSTEEAWSAHYQDARRRVIDLMNRADQIYADEASRTVVRYTNGTHWKMRDLVIAQEVATDALLRCVGHLSSRIDKLETELRAERKAKALPYAGAWKAGEQYEAGQFVSYQGSVWHVEKRNRSRPGDDPGAYTLAVKRGQDGKDAQP